MEIDKIVSLLEIVDMSKVYGIGLIIILIIFNFLYSLISMVATSKNERKIEGVKQELQLLVEKNKSLNDQITHKNILLFDEELEIYKRLSPFIYNVKDSLLSYMVNINDTNKRNEKESLVDKNLDLLRAEMSLSSLFIDSKILETLENYYKNCSSTFIYMRIEGDSEKIMTNMEVNMKAVIDDYILLRDAIREHLKAKSEIN